MKQYAFGCLLTILASVASAAPQSGGTLVLIYGNTPRHLNPAVQSGIATAIPGTQIFAAPLRYDENWNPQPYLAQSWAVSDDGLTVTLNLVKNAKFHDGQPITSEDVAFSVKTVQENHPFKTMFAPVAAVETPDAHTAVLKLTQPHPAILLAMSSALLPIIPKHIYDDGQDPKTHPRNTDPVGSGPFKFVEYKPGEYIVLERNADYFIPERPYLDKIIIKVSQDASNRVIAMERAEAHIYPFASNLRDIKRLNEHPDLTATPEGYAAVGPITWLAFNHQKPPFDDQRVRQAIAYAVDRNFITKALHIGLSQPATGPIVPGSPFYAADVETYDVDVDQANALLNAAGQAKGSDGMRFSASVDFIPGVPEQQKAIAEYLKSQLKKIGVDVQVRPSPDFPTWAKRVSNHEFDMSMDIVFNWGDPVIGVHRTYVSDNIRKGVIWSNTQGYANPKVDELLAQAAVERDPEQRKSLYAEFQRIVAAELPVYWTNVVPYNTIYNNGLGNVPKSIWGTMAPMDEVYWENPPR